MLKIIISTAIQKEATLKQTVMIIVFWNNTDIIFLNIMTDFDSMIIFLIIEALNESAIIVIKLTNLEFTVKKQFIVNQ